ncbi:MAG: flagellar cap protein FliD, partial [Betaproteobacteria bacterium]|nr:flagellar cap protein FliD [Betaproteobacteria bacterium]
MATISSLGVGSGLDLNGMVSKLVALERQPLQGLQSRASAIQTRISTFGQLGSQLAQLADAASALASSSGWNTQRASSAESAVVQAAVKGGSGSAQAG